MINKPNFNRAVEDARRMKNLLNSLENAETVLNAANAALGVQGEVERRVEKLVEQEEALKASISSLEGAEAETKKVLDKKRREMQERLSKATKDHQQKLTALTMEMQAKEEAFALAQKEQEKALRIGRADLEKLAGELEKSEAALERFKARLAAA